MEVDDIDDLLDEVESKFCSPKSRQMAMKSSMPAEDLKQRRTGKSQPLTSQEELNLAIADICADDEEDYSHFNDSTMPSSITTTKKTSSTSTKCFPIFVGSSNDIPGLSTVAHKRVCNSLHCTSCDHKVIQFKEYKWDKSCDYLFFRNNYPDFDRLKLMLTRSRGKRAYSCQCNWLSVEKIKKLEEALPKTNSRWICAGH